MQNKKKKKSNSKDLITTLEENVNNIANKLEKKIDHKKLVEEEKNSYLWKNREYYVEAFKDKLITFGMIGLILLVIIGTFTISMSIKKNKNAALKDTSINETGYNVKIHVEFTENLILSRYDVKLSIGDKMTTLSHGESKDVEFYLEEGKYTLSFINVDDSSIRHEEEIEINGDMEISYKISCHFDRIDVENIYDGKEIDSNQIKIDFDKTSFTFKNYKDVVNELRELGFTNIVEKPLYDIVLGWTKEGEVESVTINGNSNYKQGNVFSKDSEIVVSYHLKSENDPSKVKPPYDCDSIKDVNYKEAENAFKNAGFKNIKLIEDTTTDSSKNEMAYLVRIGLTWADKSFSYDPDTEVEIYYYVYKKQEVKPRPEDVKLTHYGAKKAFEKYGQAIYKYGFKCHWGLDLIEAEDRDDGSIYYKVGVTITNQYNASYDAVAEGIVSGTDNNPKITNFKVK